MKVLDFGLVKELDAPREVSITQSSAITGTPLYLAPEAISTPERIDARSDLYSLGVVGYFLLTGCHLFEGNNLVEICAHHLHTRPVPPAERLGRELPRDLSEVLLRCLEKKPEARYPSARALRQALEACADARGWREEDAERWWEEHGAAVEAARARRSKSHPLSGTKTVMAGLAARVA